MLAWENLKLQLPEGGGTAVLTVDRPKALNALNSKTLSEIENAVDQIASAKGVRVLIVTGGGDKAFVAGADISEMVGLGPEGGRRFSQLGHRAFAALEALPIPTIAAVNGFALGGGLELALACDFIYASEKAKLGLPETSLGVITGFGGSQRLTRLVGRARAKELLFTADRIDAHKAKEYGLVLEVLPPDQLMPHCLSVAERIAQNGPLAVAQAKRVIEWGADADLRAANELEQQGFGLLFGTEDLQEGMRAFLEKRKASFRGA
jgi:enoyl-CoA hydratase